MSEIFQYNHWLVEYTTDDGGRLDRLRYKGYDLLTVRPESFQSPSSIYGKYETRPVYGYDDCFPSVVASGYPGLNWEIPDHGELCWLKWHASVNKNSLLFSVKSEVLPLEFKREMIFSNSEILWKFEVKNEGKNPLPFQHVMHPLIRLDEISDFEFPDFELVINERTNEPLPFKDPKELKTYLLNQPSGSSNMLFMQNIKKGEMNWRYKKGIRVNVIFSEKLFPTIGIWWNNSAYPAEEELQRNECAFEPTPGLSSVLKDNYKNGLCLSTDKGDAFAWEIRWIVSTT